MKFRLTKLQLLASFLLILPPMKILAETLEPIIVEDEVIINPNISEPEVYSRSTETSADGGEYLRQINGVNTGRFGGRGLELTIRGQSQTRLNVLLDGAYVHGGCPNRMDPPASWAALETYEKVKVIKGVQTLLYGGGGSGGTVLFERDSRALAKNTGIHGRISILANSNGPQSALADVMASSNKGYVRFLGEVKDNDNYEDGDGREIRSGFEHKQGGIILGYTPTTDKLFEMTIERNEFSDALYPGAGMDSPTEDGTFYKMRYLDKPQAKWLDDIKIELYKADIVHVMDNFSLRTPNPMMLRLTDTTSDTTGGRIVLGSSFANTNIKYGIDFQKNERDAVLYNTNASPRSALFNMWPDVTIKQLGFFTEATSSLGNKQQITYGVRIDKVSALADKADVQVNSAVGPSKPNVAYNNYYGTSAEDKDETNVGAILRYKKSLNNNLEFFTGVSRSVRTADATERYINKWNASPGQRWIGNPQIEPEKHHQLDVGLAKKTDRFSLSANMFYDKVSDYILRDVAREPQYAAGLAGANIYRNIDARLWGVEVQGIWKITNKFDITAELSYVNATNTSDGDRPIAQTPPLSGKVQIDYKNGAWSLGGRTRFADNQSRVDTVSPSLEIGKTGGWAVVDLYGSYNINKTFSLKYGVDNLLDHTYAEHASRSDLFALTPTKVNEPGRSVWLKLTTSF